MADIDLPPLACYRCGRCLDAGAGYEGRVVSVQCKAPPKDSRPNPPHGSVIQGEGWFFVLFCAIHQPASTRVQ